MTFASRKASGQGLGRFPCCDATRMALRVGTRDRGRTRRETRCRVADAASRSEDRDRSCDRARCRNDRRAHRSDSGLGSASTSARERVVLRVLRTGSRSLPSSSMPIEKSLQRSRPRKFDTPACHARSLHDTYCSSAPSRRITKCADTRTPRSVRRSTDERRGRGGSGRSSAIASPPNSSGGRLMLCTTMSVGSIAPGRASKFGDGSCVAAASQPSASTRSGRSSARRGVTASRPDGRAAWRCA